MFTGIIDHCGIIVDLQTIPHGVTLTITHAFTELQLGESIAIDGICLTVTRFDRESFSCDLSPETLTITTAKQFKIGKQVNLERALQLSSRLGGHFVMAHVDQVACVKEIKPYQDFIEVNFCGISPLSQKCIIEKGSIAINGISLTINNTFPDGFNVMLIPHTLNKTNLKQLKAGDEVNIELDMLAKLVVKQLENVKT